MASLQARSSLRSTHPLVVFNKLVSLMAFIVLLGAGWVAVNYLKNELVRRFHNPVTDNRAPAAVDNAAARVDPSSAIEARPLATPVRLVYSCGEDKQFYHASTHLPQHCQRAALSVEAAIRRGLKHCPVCLPE